VSADLYAAWLTAGDNLQPVGAWLASDGAWVPIFAVAAVIIWRIWRIRPRDDYRTRNDRTAAWRATCEPRPEPGAPGNDFGLYLDCLAVYGDCDDLDRLRAIDQHRKEKP
jgi:hypothetical protein